MTGGAGFIGSHLVERLLADGKSVTVVDDLSTGTLDNLRAASADPRLRVIESRVSTCRELAQLVAGAESIYHLAAAVGVDLVVRSPIHVLQTNLHETEVLLEAAAGQRVPVVSTLHTRHRRIGWRVIACPLVWSGPATAGAGAASQRRGWL